MKEILNISPADIEKESFAIISRELGGRRFDPQEETVIKRVIHTTADFDYADNLYFSPDAVRLGTEAIASGARIVTDTRMAYSGINKRSAEKLGCTVSCFMEDPDVAENAKARGVTRAMASVDKAAALKEPLIYVVGNAPTALIRLRRLLDEGTVDLKFIIGAPVGFVNVEVSKEMIMEAGRPCIVARGRKGGSNVAAAIMNALLYRMDESRGEAYRK